MCDKQKKELKKNHQNQTDHLNNEIGTLKGQYKNAISTVPNILLENKF